MERIRFTLRRIEEEQNEDLDACKLLGRPVMPEGFMDKLPLKDEDYFVAQIRCDALPSRPPFPEKGFLYIFLNINTLKPKVFYTEKEPAEVIGDINGAFDPESCGDPTCLQMVFEPGGNSLFGEVDPDIFLEADVDLNDKLTLLEIDAYSLPESEMKPLMFGNFGMSDGHWVFLIKESDLKARNFRKVEFVETED